MKSLFLISLGCARNLIDSEYALNLALESGYILKDEPDDVDFAIVNTCGFIKDAKDESIDVILDLVRLKESGKIRKIVVGGCLTQRYAKDLYKDIPELDAIIGINWDDLTDVLKKCARGDKVLNVKDKKYLLPYGNRRDTRLTPAHYAYLKISEGCSHKCSYCAIYNIKGPHRSRALKDIVEEADWLVSSGVKEINIVGQDTTSYGIDLSPKASIVKILKALNSIKGDFWIRLLYAYPGMVTEELISCYENLNKLCRYLDLPLQHISDKILAKMNRKSSQKEIFRLLEKMRLRINGLCIRTSFIVGFPGETEKEFQELLRFIKDFKFERMGVFIYSREDDTQAYRFRGQVSERIKKDRFDIVMSTQNQIAEEVNKKFISRRLKVLIDEEEGDFYAARSEYDAPEVDGVVYIPKNSRMDLGNFYKVTIKRAEEYDLIAEST